MSRKLTIGFTIILSILLLSMIAVAPVMGDEGNIICHTDDDEEWTTTPLGGIIGTVTTLIVTLAALVSIVFGAGYTLASAAKPGNDKYVTNRNKAVMFGVGSLVVLYGANAIVSEFGEDKALDFSCILPFA